MQLSLAIAATFVALLATSSISHAQSRGSAYESVFGACRGDTCVIRDNPGGDVRKFLAAAKEIRRSGKRVVIDGQCASACAIFADVARERVCITKRATFGFHKASVFRAQVTGNVRKWERIRRHDPEHSSDIANWVYRNGGFPVSGLNVMPASEGAKFWRRCELRTRS
ncbi:MAG: hypothetical protein ACT6QU_12310 [Aliihoeflea sp.]|jgi:hypothetical protein|uniref:hypothetical protein n=1 Tax=unclassified Aliihoeflea TaxID=2628764 RepID=UPI0004632B5D|nr:hypothetical protein [Aliihoeflea sp. 2WW]